MNKGRKLRNYLISPRQKHCSMEEEVLLLELRLLQNTKACVYFGRLRRIFKPVYSLTAFFGGNDCFTGEKRNSYTSNAF
jgi:hypothetical protein